MKKSMIIVLFMVMVLSLSINVIAEKAYFLAHVYDPSHPWHKGAEIAAQMIEEKTGGNITIKIFPSSQLGSEEEITEAVIHGAIPIVISGAGQVGNLFKPIYVAEMPYIFQDIDHVIRFANSDIAKELFDDLKEQFGVKVIGASSFGVRHIVANKPIRTPDDLKGFKLRVPEQQVCIAYGQAMGANPTPISYGEAYMALQQGVADGLENPLTAIKAMKFYEVADYISLTGHVINTTFFLMNNAAFESLSKEEQAIFTESFNKAALSIANTLKEQDKELVSFFEKEGLTIVKPDVEAFKRATASMPAEFSDWWSKYGKDLYQRIQNL